MRIKGGSSGRFTVPASDGPRLLAGLGMKPMPSPAATAAILASILSKTNAGRAWNPAAVARLVFTDQGAPIDIGWRNDGRDIIVGLRQDRHEIIDAHRHHHQLSRLDRQSRKAEIERVCQQLLDDVTRGCCGYHELELWKFVA